MERTVVFALAMASLLTGCTLGPNETPPHVLTDAQIEQLRAEVRTIGDDCRMRRQTGRLRGFVASVQCSNPGILYAYEKIDYPYMSVLRLALAQRLQLAERADAQKISEGDMLVEFYSDARGLPAMASP